MSSTSIEMNVTLRYFAWVREKAGRAEERVDLPPETATVGDVIAWLKTRGPEYAEAFAKSEVIRAAIDQAHVKHSAPVAGAREIAFFPPVTGG
jgi:sulfur-carrier protein